MQIQRIAGGEPHRGVGLAAHVTGVLAGRKGGNEETGVVAPGLGLGRDPVCPRPEEVGAQAQPPPFEQAGQALFVVDQGKPIGFPRGT